ENNYLSDSEHRQKTSLEYKEKQGKITKDEQQKLAELRIKDEETTQKVIDACTGGVSPECTEARKDAFATLETYVDLTYQNPKTAQAGYQEIDRLLSSTSPEGLMAFDLVEGYTEAFKNFGYSDEDARKYAGMYVGSIYLIQGTYGFNKDEPIDVAVVNGKMIIIDGHHRAEAARKAGIKDIPVRINTVTKEQGDQLLREAAEARARR
uniref:ParB/RepB/Spo0J family partition protein n=3 Tax=Morganellaceae TaxID=1903414 RepID=UPI002348F42B